MKTRVFHGFFGVYTEGSPFLNFSIKKQPHTCVMRLLRQTISLVSKNLFSLMVNDEWLMVNG
jgi:hypothetical protein